MVLFLLFVIYLSFVGLGLPESLLGSVPLLYGHSSTSTIVGVDMAIAHAGSALMPPLFGVIADKISLRLFPHFIFILMVTLLLSSIMISRQKTAEMPD